MRSAIAFNGSYFNASACSANTSKRLRRRQRAGQVNFSLASLSRTPGLVLFKAISGAAAPFFDQLSQLFKYRSLPTR
mgnify:CR=1 FL=1